MDYLILTLTLTLTLTLILTLTLTVTLTLFPTQVDSLRRRAFAAAAAEIRAGANFVMQIEPTCTPCTCT